ncbi:hypothetical protein I4U23_020224 [Adineta vaga]|nr:hypothetical protein I4U23_020224 [Adineta vaga]
MQYKPYDPKRANSNNVAHLLAFGNEFIASTTFPEIRDCESFTKEQEKLMKSIGDMHIINFDYILAKGNQVAIRYTVEGSHCREPYRGITASRKKATWTVVGIFQLENSKITLFIKEWNKSAMWQQFGFPHDEEAHIEMKPIASCFTPLPSLIDTSLETIRHYLHAQPELSSNEKMTAACITTWLKEVGATRVITDLGGYGVAGVFSGPKPGPRVMLRADLDALPIHEKSNGREWCSRNENVAHSCGHDGHMAILLGIAKQLSYQPPVRGEVVLLFQPAEETGDGARAIIQCNKFDASLRPDVAYALHNQPGHSLGEIAIREGAFACASRGMIVHLQGRCTHAAHPDQGLSPARVMCHLIEKLEQLPRSLPATQELRLLTIIHAKLGEIAFGTSPGEAVIMATLRTATDDLMQPMVEAARALIECETQQAGIKYDIKFCDIFDAVMNDQHATKDVINCARKCEKKLTLMSVPARWSEDFGVFSSICPSAMFLLGAGETAAVLHDAAYDFPDALIQHGVDMFWALLNEHELFETDMESK